ncbi:MAG: hypothetical protein GX456_15730 [Verrucomicrobia bacterium]|nr:hypothetical protein [Verrucomicrobiota bacterium]
MAATITVKSPAPSDGPAGRRFAAAHWLGNVLFSSADKLKVLIALLLKNKPTAILLEHEPLTELLIIPLLSLDELRQELVEAKDKDDATREAGQSRSISGVNLLS